MLKVTWKQALHWIGAKGWVHFPASHYCAAAKGSDLGCMWSFSLRSGVRNRSVSV